MRHCRRFLAGIPHQRAGCPRVTHPSATRSLSSCDEKKLVRLACVRHAASVYPEPGSNSPSNRLYRTLFTKGVSTGVGATLSLAASLSQASRRLQASELRSRPSCLLLCKHLAVRRLCSCSP
ncbi:MAG: hypothetical protein E6I80_06080 [Chloroflexi bacterium]|nr:MAG: hypothetical protein E6I80_06080 [Chloroflexota bacterium]